MYPHAKRILWVVMACIVPANLPAQFDSKAPASEVAQVGQSNADAGRDVSVQRLLQRIEELEASQRQMQVKLDKLAVSTPAVPAAPAPSVAPTAAEPVSASAATNFDDSDGNHRLGPVEFRGFSDFDYGRAWFAQLPPRPLAGSPNSFGIGDFDLFTNTRIGERWSLLGELLVTSDFTNEFSVELDRLMLSYTASDYLKISIGKFNTAIGYYPNAFHRAHYFQTGVSRPIMFADEDDGGILPIHSIGVTATGKVPSGSLGLHWVAELANGRSSNSADVPIQNFVDENNGKAFNLALYVKPEWLRGFQAGASIYRDTLHPAGVPAIGQTILSAHLVYVGTKLEWLNEAAMIRNDVTDGGRVFRSTTSYTQLSRAFGRTRPYFRYDYQNVPAGDPVFAALERRNGPSIGVAERVSPYVVLKFQYGLLQQRGLPAANDVDAQLAIAF